VRLLGLSAALAVAAVALAVWAVSAYRFASTAHGWPKSLGRVVQPDPRSSAAAVRFTDAAGAVHLMPLKANDTDDLPVGSVIFVSYDIAADGRIRSEFRVQPGARASALTVLALLSAAGSIVAVRLGSGDRSSGRVREVAHA
jgi:hypothetical protein